MGNALSWLSYDNWIYSRAVFFSKTGKWSPPSVQYTRGIMNYLEKLTYFEGHEKLFVMLMAKVKDLKRLGWQKHTCDALGHVCLRDINLSCIRRS